MSLRYPYLGGISDPAWTAEMIIPYRALGAMEAVLEAMAEASSSFEEGAAPDPLQPAVSWVLQLMFETAPDEARIRHAVAEAAAIAGIDAPEVRFRHLPAQDWVSHTNRLFQPLRVGRFLLHGAHDRERAPVGRGTLQVDAGQAFGTGRAPSTFGCLLALDRLARQRPLGRVLDLGSGSGVLAMAAARLGADAVMATDIDPVAVKVARDNARLNRLPGIAMVAATGFRHRRIAAAAPFDVIVANILSGPLYRLAEAAANHSAASGAVILSGLLGWEERRVRARYRAAGFVFTGRIAVDGWHTLSFRAGRARRKAR